MACSKICGHLPLQLRHIEGARVKLLDKIGEGLFGAVYLGVYDAPIDYDGIGGEYNVAVKVLKEDGRTEEQIQMTMTTETVAERHQDAVPWSADADCLAAVDDPDKIPTRKPLHKDDVIQNVLDRQEVVCAEEAEAYRNIWREARTMAALCAGRGQLRIKYGKLTRKSLVDEAVLRDVQHEERRRIKLGHALQDNTSLCHTSDVSHDTSAMTEAEKVSWVDQRMAEWEKIPEEGGLTEDMLTDLLLDYNDMEGRLVGHTNVAKIIGMVVDEKQPKLLLQLAAGGDLKKYLEAHSPQTS
jgi:serine/threonine protein kinase